MKKFITAAMLLAATVAWTGETQAQEQTLHTKRAMTEVFNEDKKHEKLRINTTWREEKQIKYNNKKITIKENKEGNIIEFQEDIKDSEWNIVYYTWDQVFIWYNTFIENMQEHNESIEDIEKRKMMNLKEFESMIQSIKWKGQYDLFYKKLQEQWNYPIKKINNTIELQEGAIGIRLKNNYFWHIDNKWRNIEKIDQEKDNIGMPIYIKNNL